MKKVFLAVFMALLLVTVPAGARSKSKAVTTKTPSGSLPPGAAAAMQNVNAERIRADVRFLSSDLLEGRGTGQRGGDVAATYIATQFALAGLKPMGDNGSYLQKVPMVGVSTQPGSSLEILPTNGEAMNLRPLEDCVLMDESQQTESDVSSEVIFAGYGISAPEYNWNDYAGLDVKGKILLMLVNEPPSNDDAFFKGRALTYYGRWTYKFEHAAEMGAAGVILVHREDMASYGWEVVRASWSGERSYLRSDKSPKLKLASWVQFEVAKKLAAGGGQDLDQLIAAAQKPGFKAVKLNVMAKSHVVSKVRPFDSQNVIGAVEGSDPKLKQQAIIYTGHYDHLGIRPEMPGDNIYNGALDNATGTSMVIEMARAVSASPVKPKRTLIFATVTAEEQGLWGSNYLGLNPPIPAKDISLNLNFDSIAPLGIPKEVSAGGYERTNFAPVFEKTASDFGFAVITPQHPESGGYYRSDHFSFARVGVPAFSVNAGSKFEGHSAEWVSGLQKQMAKNYHQPTDEYRPEFDYRADAVIARFGLALGYKAADLPAMVQWMPGDEFAAHRKSAEGQ